MFEIRLAGSMDIPKILNVLEDAAKWQVRTDRLNQWDTSKFTADWLQESVDRKEIVVAHDQENVVGSIMYSERISDAWAGAKGSGLYLSKLGVLREWASKGVGEGLLRWCDIHAAKARLTAVRFDCPDSEGFINYYLRQQYLLRGRGSRGYYRYVLFEKLLEEI